MHPADGRPSSRSFLDCAGRAGFGTDTASLIRSVDFLRPALSLATIDTKQVTRDRLADDGVEPSVNIGHHGFPKRKPQPDQSLAGRDTCRYAGRRRSAP